MTAGVAKAITKRLLGMLQPQGLAQGLEASGGAFVDKEGHRWLLREVGGELFLCNRTLELELKPSPTGTMLHPEKGTIEFITLKPKGDANDDRLLKAFQDQCELRRKLGASPLPAADLNNLACALGWQGLYEGALKEIEAARAVQKVEGELKTCIDENAETLNRAKKARRGKITLLPHVRDMLTKLREELADVS